MIEVKRGLRLCLFSLYIFAILYILVLTIFFLFDFEFWEVDSVGLGERRKWPSITVHEYIYIYIYEYTIILEMYRNLSLFWYSSLEKLNSK